MEVWKQIMLTGAVAALVPLLVFLFGTDVVGRLNGGEMPVSPLDDNATMEPLKQEGRLYASYSFKKKPFVHPKIINDLVGYLSDVGIPVKMNIHSGNK